MTSHLQQPRTKRWRASQGANGSFILLMQSVSELSSCTQGMSVYFLLLKASAVYTGSLKQTSSSSELPSFHPKVGFQSLSRVKARVKCSDLRVISPLVTHLMVWPMPTDDDYGDVRAKELKAALAGCRLEGGGSGGGGG